MMSWRMTKVAALLFSCALTSCTTEPEIESQGEPGARGDALASLVVSGGAGRLRQARFAFNTIGVSAAEVNASLREGQLVVDLASVSPLGDVIVQDAKLTGQTSYESLSLGVAAACVDFDDPTGMPRVLTSAPAFGDCGPSNGSLRFETGSLVLPFPEGFRFEPSVNARVVLEIDASEALHFDQGLGGWRFEPTLKALPQSAAALLVVQLNVPPGSERVASDYDVTLVSERSTARHTGRPDSAGRMIFSALVAGLYSAHVSSADGTRLQVDGLLPKTLRLGSPESVNVVVSEIEDGTRIVSSGLVFISENSSGVDPVVVATPVPSFAEGTGQTLTVALREVGSPESGCPGGEACLALVWAGNPARPNRMLTPATSLTFSLTAGDGLLTSGSEVSDAMPVEVGDDWREWTVTLDQALPTNGEIQLELSVENLTSQVRLLAWEIRLSAG